MRADIQLPPNEARIRIHHPDAFTDWSERWIPELAIGPAWWIDLIDRWRRWWR